jgi:hypothetical protein
MQLEFRLKAQAAMVGSGSYLGWASAAERSTRDGSSSLSFCRSGWVWFEVASVRSGAASGPLERASKGLNRAAAGGPARDREV